MDRKPRERRRARTREEILDAARALVLEAGHERLSLREVARRADFSPAGLYEYFDGREALLAGLAERALGRLAAALGRAARADEAAGSAAARLVAIGTAYVAFARGNPEDFLLLFGRLPSERRSTREEVPAASPYRPLLDAAAAVLAGRGRPAGPEEADAAAYGFWGLAHGLALLRITHLAGVEADFDAADRAAFEAFARGLTS